jgi:hypothetical protein
MRVRWLPRDEVVIHDTWRTTGLAGTGSNDYEVDGVLVPARHGVHPFRPGPRSETLYRYQGIFTREQRAGIGLLGINAVQSAVRASELVCEAVGSDALYASSPFDRRRRDLVTMAAHVLGARKT